MRRIITFILLIACTSILYALPKFTNVKWVIDEPLLYVETIFNNNNTVSILRYNRKTGETVHVMSKWKLDTNLNILIVDSIGYAIHIDNKNLILTPYAEEDSILKPIVFKKEY